MVRKILVPTENTYLLHLPDSFVGRSVEVLAFEVEAPAEGVAHPDAASTRARLEALVAGYLVDLRNFKFDRNEANNYDDE